eukprot:TRINITY_DN8168_c0_g1_i2.p1 TRINITY_DN8168_c0_g1~~TRINITY_DN8168_c0_g1_i2.p1  ORF type:complete len:202 (-),score=-12.93 TRINITY_DN8168_c0_g1_i2:254-859(-)
MFRFNFKKPKDILFFVYIFKILCIIQCDMYYAMLSKYQIVLYHKQQQQQQQLQPMCWIPNNNNFLTCLSYFLTDIKYVIYNIQWYIFFKATVGILLYQQVIHQSKRKVSKAQMYQIQKQYKSSIYKSMYCSELVFNEVVYKFIITRSQTLLTNTFAFLNKLPNIQHLRIQQTKLYQKPSFLISLTSLLSQHNIDLHPSREQ